MVLTFLHLFRYLCDQKYIYNSWKLAFDTSFSLASSLLLFLKQEVKEMRKHWNTDWVNSAQIKVEWADREASFGFFRGSSSGRFRLDPGVCGVTFLTLQINREQSDGWVLTDQRHLIRLRPKWSLWNVDQPPLSIRMEVGQHDVARQCASFLQLTLQNKQLLPSSGKVPSNKLELC